MLIFSALPEDERRRILHMKTSTKTPDEDKVKAPVTSASPHTNQVSGNSQVSDPLQTEGIQAVSFPGLSTCLYGKDNPSSQNNRN
jgi:hypothetical protein